jgi:DNA polymerase III alpha subunit
MIANQEQSAEESLLYSLYAGIDISSLPIPHDLKIQYEKYQDELDLPSISENPKFDYSWFMPEKYKDINVKSYLIEKCKTQKEINRVEEELMLFEMADKIDFIKYMIYLVDHMNQNGIVWGVGRGSSVSIFIFYLLGIHKVDSLKYELEYSDFFKIGEET